MNRVGCDACGDTAVVLLPDARRWFRAHRGVCRRPDFAAFLVVYP